MPFDVLHKAKIDTGLDASLPATPEGVGDVYFAPDGNSGDGALYLTNAAGDTWVEFVASGGGGGATALGDLTDVDVLGASNGQVLTYNSGASEWQPQNITVSMSDLLDVDLTGLTDGDVLIYDNVSGDWIHASKVTAINDLSDVASFTQVKGDMLASDGSVFDTLGVGVDGQTLVADSGETLGMRWATGPSGTVDNDARIFAIIGW